MRSLVCNYFNWFVTFIRITLFFLEIFRVGCTWIKFISLWIDNIGLLGFLMRISTLLGEMRSIGCTWVEWLSIRVELIIFYENSRLIYPLRAKLIGILRSRSEGDIFILIFDPWNYFFSHLRFSTWIMFPICRINIVIRLILLSF